MIISRLLLVLALSVPCSSLAFAQAEPGPEEKRLTLKQTVDNIMPVVGFPDPPKLDLDGELQYWLDRGKVAPFDGVQLNPEAASLVLSEYRAQKSRGEAALEKQRAADFAVFQHETGRLKVELAAVKKKSDIQKQADVDAKERLKSINEDLREDKRSPWGDIFKVGAGVGAGVLVGLVIGLVAGGG